MTKLATMGTSSCATIALNGFKNVDQEESYLALPEEEKKNVIENVKEDVAIFYTNILYPTSQPLGASEDWPFNALMEVIDKHEFLKTKFTILTLNPYQNMVKDGFWKSQLEKWGFTLVDKSANSTMGGDINYIYVRNLGRVD